MLLQDPTLGNLHCLELSPVAQLSFGTLSCTSLSSALPTYALSHHRPSCSRGHHGDTQSSCHQGALSSFAGVLEQGASSCCRLIDQGQIDGLRPTAAWWGCTQPWGSAMGWCPHFPAHTWAGGSTDLGKGELLSPSCPPHAPLCPLLIWGPRHPQASQDLMAGSDQRKSH